MLSSKISFKSYLVLGLITILSGACSNGAFIGGAGSSSKKSEKADPAAAAMESNRITSVDELLALPAEEYYLQTYINIQRIVGDEEFEYEGYTFANIASNFGDYLNEAMDSGEMSGRTWGEMLEEKSVEVATVNHDEFLEALDKFDNVNLDGLGETELKLSSSLNLESLLLFPFYYSGNTQTSCRVTINGVTQTSSGGVCGLVSGVSNLPAQPTAAKAGTIATTPGAVTKPCNSLAKSTFNPQVQGPNGTCISKVQKQFDEMSAGNKVSACKNLNYLRNTFYRTTLTCISGSGCDPQTDVYGKPINNKNGFSAGTNAQEFAIAQYGAAESERLFASNCSK